MHRFLGPALLLTLTLACAAPAAAQPYAYALTQGGVFRSGVHLTVLPPRLVTIDPSSAQAIASLTLTPCSTPRGLAVRADGLRVFVACDLGGSASSVLVIDPVAKQIVHARTLTTPIGDVAVTPAGDRLVLPGVLGPSLVVDSETLNTLGTLANAPVGGVFGFHQPAVVSLDGAKAYLMRSSKFSSIVNVYSLADFSYLTSIDGGELGGNLALTGDGTRLIIGSFNRMTIADTATDTIVNTVALSSISGVAANAGTRAYASRSSGISVVDLGTAAVAGEIPPALASVLATNAARTRLFAAMNSLYTVAIVDLASGTTIGSTVVKGGVLDMATSAASPVVAPDACSYAISFRAGGFTAPPPRQSPAGSTEWRIDVIALPDRCTWTAQSDVPWITFEYASGTGTDNVGITIAPNTTGASRVGTITIGGQALTVAQAGCSNPIVFFERPSGSAPLAQPYMVSGWGIDTCSVSGPGLEEASVPSTGYGRARPDVAAAFGGSQFTNSGFEFRDTFERTPGVQEIGVSFRSTITGQPVTATVRANILPSIAPFGAIDTPTAGATVSGDMALTGWVMDDVGTIGNVLIYRDSLPGEGSSPGTPGKIFVGVATRVAGARPDVQALFPSYADNDRAGFGAMILTNALPNGGNGTFTFHVQVADRYNAVWLGSRTVTVNNASSPLPFGAVDTPQPGQTVSGTVTLWGWALTPGTNMIPLDGSSIDVLIDGVFVGHPTYNVARPDVQALFPGYTNSAAPGGFLNFDTRTLANGLHTIAWVVRDNAGNAKGIGSRFFTVSNQ